MPLTHYGLREWMTITVVCALLVLAAGWLGWWWAVVVMVVVWLGLVAFFRDPIRRVPGDLGGGDMISPADGTVWSVTEVSEHEATGGPAVVIRIFLSVLNVHVNRSPFEGEVVEVKYRPGMFFDARSDECATQNESNLVVMRIEPEVEGWGPVTIGVRQVSGKLARRIVCGAKVGDRLSRGEKYGMIKFGSSTELILSRPERVRVHVSRGEMVRGGKTVIATLE